MGTIAAVLSVGTAMMIAERLRPRSDWGPVKGWLPRAAALNLVQAAIVFVASATWDTWLQGATLWSLEAALGPVAGVAVGYVAITFVFYWWHRARHEVPLLWRWFHQIHHSAQRLEVMTSFYKHPLEIVVNSVLSSLVLHVLCGLSPATAATVTLLTGLAELFYHWNVQTPYWLGFVVQRPESHCAHHERGIHKRNFSDLPVWDMLFGTFHNPRQFTGKCGFAPAQERKLRQMLCGIDVQSGEAGQ